MKIRPMEDLGMYASQVKYQIERMIYFIEQDKKEREDADTDGLRMVILSLPQEHI